MPPLRAGRGPTPLRAQAAGPRGQTAHGARGGPGGRRGRSRGRVLPCGSAWKTRWFSAPGAPPPLSRGSRGPDPRLHQSLPELRGPARAPRRSPAASTAAPRPPRPPRSRCRGRGPRLDPARSPDPGLGSLGRGAGLPGRRRLLRSAPSALRAAVPALRSAGLGGARARRRRRRLRSYCPRFCRRGPAPARRRRRAHLRRLPLESARLPRRRGRACVAREPGPPPSSARVARRAGGAAAANPTRLYFPRPARTRTRAAAGLAVPAPPAPGVPSRTALRPLRAAVLTAAAAAARVSPGHPAQPSSGRGERRGGAGWGEDGPRPPRRPDTCCLCSRRGAGSCGPWGRSPPRPRPGDSGPAQLKLPPSREMPSPEAGPRAPSCHLTSSFPGKQRGRNAKPGQRPRECHAHPKGTPRYVLPFRTSLQSPGQCSRPGGP